MVDFGILLGLTPNGNDIARHIKRKKVEHLKQDAAKLSKQSSSYIKQVVQDTVSVLGLELTRASKGAHDQAYLINFVADLTGEASTQTLHYLVHNYHVETQIVVDAFHSAVGSGDNDRAMNLMKAFPELIFEKFSEDKCVYEHFGEKHWSDLLNSKVINAQFFKGLTDGQAILIFKAMPPYEPLLKSKSLLQEIITREPLRNQLLNYFDYLVRTKNNKATFIMRLATMPLTSCDSDGNWRIVAYCKSISCDARITEKLGNAKKIDDLNFLAELLSIVEIPTTLDAYQTHLQIGKFLSARKSLKRKILDHIKDPKKRHERNEILDYCLEVYKNSDSSTKKSSN